MSYGEMELVREAGHTRYKRVDSEVASAIALVEQLFTVNWSN